MLVSSVRKLGQLVVCAELQRLLELDGHALASGASQRHLRETEQHLPFVAFLEQWFATKTDDKEPYHPIFMLF